MKGHSLKIRLLWVGTIVLILALSLTGFGLTTLFERHVERRISLELDTYITQIASRLSFAPSGLPQLDDKLADPRFKKIYSGLYWQIHNETAGLSVRSRSLWDTQLNLPVDSPGFGKVHIHTTGGPQDTSLLVHERRLLFKSPKGQQVVRLLVAIHLDELKKMSSQFANEVLFSLLSLCLFLLFAGWVQIVIGLGPLSHIQKSIAAIRDGATTRMNSDMPSEVAPLANEINNLLEAQENAIEKAKHRASDLAHGFKTPLTALRADIRRLRNNGEYDIANDLDATSMLMQRQIDRELTKARYRDRQMMTNVKILPVIDNIVATLTRTPDGERKRFQIDCKSDLQIQIDVDDLADLLGNLVENALKHAANELRIKVYQTKQAVRFEIDDDGVGISNSKRNVAQKRGVRLDQSIAGTGLGLAIVKDILNAYNENLELSSSPMGGLRASFQFPLPPDYMV